MQLFVFHSWEIRTVTSTSLLNLIFVHVNVTLITCFKQDGGAVVSELGTFSMKRRGRERTSQVNFIRYWETFW